MKQLQSLYANIIAGTRLALMMRVSRADFRYTIGQAVLLLLVFTVLGIGFEFVSAQPGGPFNVKGLIDLGIGFAASLFAYYVVCLIQKAPGNFIPLFISQYSIIPVLVLAMAMAIGFFYLVMPAVFGVSDEIPIWVTIGFAFTMPVAGLVAIVWMVAISIRILRLVFDVSNWRGFFLTLLIYGIGFAPLAVLPSESIWGEFTWDMPSDHATAETVDTETDEAKTGKRDHPAGPNVEYTYYAQPGLIDDATGLLKGERPGIADLYFVGFASYASQDVFLREVRSVRQLFDSRFKTKGRSIVLINNRKTVEKIPLASVNNLGIVLKRISARMNTKEDVLFLFLTSHGGKEGYLAVDFYPLRLNALTPTQLRKMLDESGIKWRILVVSACYAGSFIDALKTENTLILTAARKDRQSFGCSHERAFTKFGKAYFDQQLRKHFSFVEAFHGATKAIAERETREELTPSLPQIHIGDAIRPKLRELERQLRN